MKSGDVDPLGPIEHIEHIIDPDDMHMPADFDALGDLSKLSAQYVAQRSAQYQKEQQIEMITKQYISQNPNNDPEMNEQDYFELSILKTMSLM